MGITIHYSGTFRSDASLTNFIEETVAFAEATGWECTLFEREFPPENSVIKQQEDARYGLLLLPPECESVDLFFNHERQLGFYYDPQESIIESWIGDPGTGEWVRDEIDPELKPHWSAFTKTQYAGSAVHKNIVLLFKQLSEKYFSNFEVIDEADYWENGDDDYLRRRFGEGIDIDMNNFDPDDPKYRLPVK